jgi:ATP-dependent Lhr-like helicase
MELGIDVGRVDHVVQYGSPREVARLLQRVGRAGHRSDRVSSGTVVTGSADDTFEAMAIARRGAADAVEPADVHEGSLDVVANQVVGLAMDFGDVSARRAYELVTAAYPYRDLSESAFRDVVRDVARNGLLWLDEDADRIEKSGGTWQYFYANLSMIPDEETYDVVNMAAGGRVGTLDERFVRNFAEPGASFIQGGEMWRIAEVDDEETTVRVTPIEDPSGEVPSWTGREIPVPRAVAGEVGELRGVVGAQLAAGGDPDSVAADLAARYPADEATVATAVDQVRRQVAADAPVPTDERVVVEREGRTVVVNAPFGHQINETLGRLLAALVGQRTGSSVGMETDPYRIELDLPTGLGAKEVVEVLSETDPDHVAGLIELSLKNSDSLKFTLAHVAAKFGALKRYRGSAGPAMGGERLLAALEDTPAYEEAVREVLHEELDVPGAASVLAEIQREDLAVVVHGGHTPVGTDGRSSGRELLAPADADASVVQAVEERILDDDVRLVCLHCGDYDRQRPVRRVDDQPDCPRCGSTRIAALSPWATETVAALRATEKDAEEEKRTRRAHRNASIVQSHGKRAVIALRGRGVGPQNAARIINRHREDEADFYRDILEREREYARTKAFWD